MVTPRACHEGAGVREVLLYVEPFGWCVWGVVATPRACHARAVFCMV